MPTTGMRSPDFGIGFVMSGSSACSTGSAAAAADRRGAQPRARPAPAKRPSFSRSRRAGSIGCVIRTTVELFREGRPWGRMPVFRYAATGPGAASRPERRPSAPRRTRVLPPLDERSEEARHRLAVGGIGHAAPWTDTGQDAHARATLADERLHQRRDRKLGARSVALGLA